MGVKRSAFYIAGVFIADYRTTTLVCISFDAILPETAKIYVTIAKICMALLATSRAVHDS